MISKARLISRIAPVLPPRALARGALIRRWDHLITIEPAGPRRTRYTDWVEAEAGLLTPLVWAFARVFYAHRQRRWQRLVAHGFRYGGVDPAG